MIETLLLCTSAVFIYLAVVITIAQINGFLR